MKRTRIHVYKTAIDSNYSAHKGYIPIPLNVQNIKSICPVLSNAEGYISLLKELDEEQILNEMFLEDDKQHINTKKVDVDVTPDSTDIKYILRITRLYPKITSYIIDGEEKKAVYDNSCTLKIIIEYSNTRNKRNIATNRKSLCKNIATRTRGTISLCRPRNRQSIILRP